MQCENTILNNSAYWLEGRRQYERCPDTAEFIVSVNPPKPEHDGKIRLCAFCNKWDFQAFPRKPLNAEDVMQ